MNIEHLRSSFQLVAPKAEFLADTFYSTLFERYPGVKPLFKNVKLKQQKGKLVASLAFIVENLENGEKLSGYLQDMGQRHVSYGTEVPHYAAVGECLLVALATTAGEAWTKELEASWAEAYGAVADLMIAGARREKKAS